MAKAVGVDRDKREFGSAVVRDNADTQCLCPLPHANIEVRTAHECGVQAVANSTAFDRFDKGAKRMGSGVQGGRVFQVAGGEGMRPREHHSRPNRPRMRTGDERQRG